MDLSHVDRRIVPSGVTYIAVHFASIEAARRGMELGQGAEWIQKRAFNIIFLGLQYDVALRCSGLLPLSQRQEKSRQELMENFRDKGFLSNIIPFSPETHDGYSLRSGSVVNSSVKVVARTERMNNFCTL